MNQLTLNLPKTPNEIERELELTKEELANTRRGLFKRYDLMQKEIALLQQELYNLKQNKSFDYQNKNALFEVKLGM